MIGVLLFFGIGCLLASCLASGARRSRPGGVAAYRRRSTGIGRAALRTMRTVNDARAIARGPGAYGKRLARRAVFRGIRRL